MNRQEAERVNIGDKLEVDGWSHSSIMFKNPVEVKAIVTGKKGQTGIMFTVETTRRELHTLDAGWFKLDKRWVGHSFEYGFDPR